MSVTVQSWWIFYGVALAAVLPVARLLRSTRSVVIALALAQERPDDPGILVRQGHCGDVRVAPGFDLIDPDTAWVGLFRTRVEGRPGAMDQQGAQVRITSLADAAQALLAAA